MSENEIPFLKQLRTELRRAAHEQSAGAAHQRLATRGWRLAGVPVLAVIGVVAWLLFAGGSTVVPSVPVVNFSGQATAATVPPPTPGTKLIGDQACIRMASGRHLPPLIRSSAAPEPALLNELGLLRSASTPADRTSLGSWDRYPLLIATVFDRYVRVVNGPKGVRLAFLPVTYCTDSEVQPSSPAAPGGMYRETLEQGLVMLVLSNRGEHPPVLVGTAQQIKKGPALAGLDIESKQGFMQAWLQAIVVPDGVSKVVMKFTPPFLHHYNNTVQVKSNAAIVVRRPDYTPTTVLWYGANGQLIKKFVDHQQLAQDDCLAAHKKSCLSTPSAGAGAPTPKYQIATNHKQAGPPALIAQANALYRPVKVFRRSITAAQAARTNAAKTRTTRQINACDAPYSHQLFQVKVGTNRWKLYMLWSDISGMQDYEVDVAAYAPQVRALAVSWMALSLKNRAMNKFAHATAAELNATLNAPSADTCAFVRAVAAHHFSYTWARTSTYAVDASNWHRQTLADGNQTSAFWRYVTPPTLYYNTSDIAHPGGPGWHLFTQKQRSQLANLPGEIG